MRLTKSIPAGLVDAGAAALATFGAGVYAANYFDPETGELGVYALFFAIFLVAAIVPFKLAFLPAEVRLLSLPPAQQLGGFRLTMPAGVPVAMVSGLLVLVAWIPAIDAEFSLVVPLAITTVITGILSPIQDHIRRVMHQAGQSWLAALTSSTQLAVAAAIITIGVFVDVDKAWIPFGSLVMANTVSIGVGLLLARGRAEPATGEPYVLSELATSGRWLAGYGLVPVVSTFLVAAIVDVTAGSDFLGFAEAARVAGRPLLVFMTGVSAVLNPRAFVAGRDRDRPAGARLARVGHLIVLGPGAVVLLWLGLEWAGNPMAWLVENAYTVEFLVVITIAANILWGFLFVEEAQLIGGRREVDIFRIYLIGGLVQVAIAFTAVWTESFAVPLAYIGFGVVRVFGFRGALRRLYEPGDDETGESKEPDPTLSAM